MAETNSRSRCDVKADLLKTAKFAESHGFVRGDRDNHRGAHCVLGCIDEAVRLECRDLVITALADVLRPLTPIGTFDDYNCHQIDEDSNDQDVLAAWNNMICRDQFEVAAKLKEAAQLLGRRAQE